MYSADTSSLIEYFKNSKGRDIELLHIALTNDLLYISPIVVTEILSDPSLPREHEEVFQLYPKLEFLEGFWERAAKNRARVLRKKLKARLADALIAQSCIDHNLQLITRDTDFRHFAKHCGLKLA